MDGREPERDRRRAIQRLGLVVKGGDSGHEFRRLNLNRW
jgi:hypothetical protein